MPHPSILIAFGAYGMRMLRNFLASAATRGVLVWDEEGVVGSLNERRLQALSLFWIPEKIGSRDGQPAENAQFESDYELMDDLFRQIEVMDGTFADIRTALEEGVDTEKKRLLDPRRHGETNMPGLDVFILAQPTSQDMIGLVRNLTEPSMSKLASDPSFETAHATSLLNFIQIFDFEDYWAPRMEPVREALRRMIDENRGAISSGRPTVGRMYIFDGNTAAGRRTAISRQQEAILFLEFLLLEDLRVHPDAKAFFERQYANMPPLCSIGIRVVERSSGLLRRLAAAAFARSWLDYLVTTQSIDKQDSPFFDLVKPFRDDNLGRIVGEQEMRSAARMEISQVESALLALSADQADWEERLRELATRQTESAIQRLSRKSGEQSATPSRVALKNFRDEIEQNITSAMQQRSPALTLGSVIDELQSLEDEFASVALEAKPSEDRPAPSTAPFVEASRMQREYFLYRSRQVQTAAMKTTWWPRIAIFFAVAFSPLMMRGFANGPMNDLMPSWVLAPLCALILGAVFWYFGRQFMQPALSSTAERARAFYTDHERGRLSERVRQVANSGNVAGRIEGYADLLVYGTKQYVLGALTDEIRRARLALIQRRDEVQWLRLQVGEFLRSNQVDDRNYPPRFEDGRVPSDVRFSLERTNDLTAVAESVPRNTDRFREQVGVRRLFDSWSRSYCDTFLHPIQFLDQLSTSFADKFEIDESETRRRAAQIATFLQRDVGVPVCFQWLVSDGLPAMDRGSLFPTSWQRFPGVKNALAQSGFAKHTLDTSSSERLYLIQYMLGIPAELLVKPSGVPTGEKP
jgi:hypothetical protein